VGWMTEESWFDSQQEQDMFLFSRMSRLTLGPIQPLHSPFHWMMGAISVHMNVVATSPYTFMMCNFTFTFLTFVGLFVYSE
jgi:hypothetical protein